MPTRAPGRRAVLAALGGLATAVLALAASPVLAQTAQPQPKPAVPAPPSPGPVKPGKGSALPGLSGEQRTVLAEVNRYFNAIRTLQGSFTQFGPDGSRSDGKFALARPGKIRFSYAKPATLDVIADGVDVVVRDRKLATQDLYPLSQTPLKFLLADRIDLTSEANVTQVSVEPDLITMVVRQSTVFGDGQLTLLFGRPVLDLKQWIVTDAQGQETTVVVFDTVPNEPVDDKLFFIDRTRILK